MLHPNYTMLCTVGGVDVTMSKLSSTLKFVYQIYTKYEGHLESS